MKEWREFRNITQEDAADRLGITRTFLSKIENIRAQYSQNLIEAAAELYNCTAFDLLRVNPAKSEPLSEIMNTVEGADPAQQARMLSVLKAMVQK